MKINKKQLQQIILEELTMLQTEADELSSEEPRAGAIGDWMAKFSGCAKDLEDCARALKYARKRDLDCSMNMQRAIKIIDKQKKKIKELERKLKGTVGSTVGEEFSE